MKPIALEYYLDNDLLFLSRDLLGKLLCTNIDGQIAIGRIVETEAYRGPDDRASHAYGGRRTKRNDVMYHKGGVAYVYLCYGIHHLFNIVVQEEGTPHAILLRALEPLEGLEVMLKRRNQTKLTATLTKGPGALSQAMGITTALNGSNLTGPRIWLSDDDFRPSDDEIATGPRIGVAYAKEHALWPWRFGLKESRWLSVPFTSS